MLLRKCWWVLLYYEANEGCCCLLAVAKQTLRPPPLLRRPCYLLLQAHFSAFLRLLEPLAKRLNQSFYSQSRSSPSCSMRHLTRLKGKFECCATFWPLRVLAFFGLLWSFINSVARERVYFCPQVSLAAGCNKLEYFSPLILWQSVNLSGSFLWYQRAAPSMPWKVTKKVFNADGKGLLDREIF